jgi:hypothetical protein
MLKARAEACKAEYEAEVAEAMTAHYPQSKAGTTSQGTNIINQALTTTPMGAAIPPPTHPTVAEALHQQSLALGIAPDPPGQVPLAPAAPVPALAPPVTLPAPVGASPGPPGDAEALHQQSLALGMPADPQGQVPLAPAPLVPAIAALAPLVTTLPAPVGAGPGPPGVTEVMHQQSLALRITLPDPQGQVPFAPMPLDPSAIAAFAPPVTALPAPGGANPGPPGVQQSLALGITPDPQGQAALAPATAALVPPPVRASPGPQEQTALAAAGSASTAAAAAATATTQPVAIVSPQAAIQPPALGLISAPLQLPEPVVCPAVHQPGHGEGPAEDSLSSGGSSVSISSQE